MSRDTQDESKKSFKDTLNLPHTDFPIRPNHAVDDAALLERWKHHELYAASFTHNKGNEKYILHDGPPYANGPIHLGHAYNKILKDTVCKARRMMGFHVPVTPGWDCHGLPIELKVTQEHPGLDPIQLKKACRKYANHWIDVQRDSFKNLGILMDWDNPYSTMSPSYEAATVRAFGKLVEKEFIERKNKTVPWCMYDKTVLALAEIEYKDRKDPSIYAPFALHRADVQRLFPEIKGTISVVIWTTTPWTLPLNQAVLVKPSASYVVLDVAGAYYLVGAQVADTFTRLLEVDKKVVREFRAEYLSGLRVQHPFVDRDVPLIFDESVGTDEGTAFVHCAPGAGPIDYEIGVKNNLEIYSPITDDGKYSSLIEPKDLVGMSVIDGQIWVIRKLAELHKLLYKTTITHSYPHCWRCHNGLIFRATPQWFFDLEKEGIKERVLSAIEKVNFIPEQGRSFLRATVENRWEWCLSRQRIWGTPIPAILCTKCEYAYLSADLIEKVAQGVEQEGIEYWDRVRIAELISDTLACPKCKAADCKKEHDILDVWFESGISHYSVLYDNPSLRFPADIYLEGIDQYRAWFQSSLIMSLVLEEEPCTRTFMSHGYTVDAQGRKMSKSLGNVIAPEDIIKQLGTDGLRLWVASIGHTSDPVVSDVLLRNVAEVYRKIRNTCRFLLSNLYDFDVQKDAVSIDQLLPLDYYALTRLSALNGTLIERYSKGDFTAVFHGLAEYCSSELSSFYLDIIKDRLYVERPDGRLRRSAQTAMWLILDTLTRLMAPVLSFTAELISDHYQKGKQVSIHLQPFVDPVKLHKLCFPEGVELWPGLVRQETGTLIHLPYDVEQMQKELLYEIEWQTLRDIRSVILKALELEREKGLIKHSLEAQIKLYIDMSRSEYTPLQELFEQFKLRGQDVERFFKEFLIVSQFALAIDTEGLQPTGAEGIFVSVQPAQGVKCPRCWQWDISSHPDHLCHRCQSVLESK
jgi:isoleucyl-tRNA synthetase